MLPFSAYTTSVCSDRSSNITSTNKHIIVIIINSTTTTKPLTQNGDASSPVLWRCASSCARERPAAAHRHPRSVFKRVAPPADAVLEGTETGGRRRKSSSWTTPPRCPSFARRKEPRLREEPKVASTYFYSNVQSYSGVRRVHSTRWNERAGSRAKRQQQQRVVFTFVREPVKAFISGWMVHVLRETPNEGAEFDRGGAGLKPPKGSRRSCEKQLKRSALPR